MVSRINGRIKVTAMYVCIRMIIRKIGFPPVAEAAGGYEVLITDYAPPNVFIF